MVYGDGNPFWGYEGSLATNQCGYRTLGYFGFITVYTMHNVVIMHNVVNKKLEDRPSTGMDMIGFEYKTVVYAYVCKYDISCMIMLYYYI